MKIGYTIIALLINCASFAQSTAYKLNLQVTNPTDIETAFVKDYIDYQLIAGSYHNGQNVFWAAKMDGDAVIWAKSFPVDNWAPMDSNPYEILKYNSNGDIMMIMRGMNNAGNYSAKVLKLNSSGTLIWSKELIAQPEYSQTAFENNPSIVENDGVIISMAGENDLVISKINNYGNLVYSKLISIQGFGGFLNTGNFFIPNHSGGYLAGFECAHAPAVISFDHFFNIQWAKRIPTGENARPRSLCQTSAGDIYIGGPGETPYETYIAKLSSSGNLQAYQQFSDSLIYSMDQLIDYNDTTLLANTRFGYAFIHLNDWGYDVTSLDYLWFNLLKNSSGSWTLSGSWAANHFLNFDLDNPQCIDFHKKTNQSSVPFAVTAEDITCNLIDHGSLVAFNPQLSNMQATISTSCYLSVPEETMNKLTVYPNPVQSGSVLSFSHEMKDATIALTDLQGKTIGETTFSQQMTIPQLTAGIYLVKITDKKGQIITRRIVVE